MVAVVSGSSLGLFNSSLALLGSGGGVGDSKEGRPNSGVYVNSATGNLVVQAQDDALAAVGLDLGLVRTYNSQGYLNDDNSDNWRLGVYENLYGLTGTVNTAGSTITKTFGDGTAIVYTYDTSLGYYVSPDGDGANDTLSYSSGTSQWTWTDGSSRASELYDSTGRLLSSRDADGNTVTYTYAGNLITQITDASGQSTYLDYTGNNLTAIRVVSQGVTQTLTRYTYDAQNRLSQVKVDLTPADNAIADNNYFLTTYTYEGTSTRISTISQGSSSTVGSSVSFTYELSNGAYRVKTYTDGEGKVTTLTYSGGSSTQTTATANSGTLTTTDTVNYNLNTGLLTTPSPTWAGASVIDGQSAAVTDPLIGFGSNGNGVALWREGANLWARPYTRSTNSWGTAVQIDNLAGTIANPQLVVDASGNALAAWVQNDGTVNSLYVAGYDASTGTWTTPTNIESRSQAMPTGANSLALAINGSNVAVSWLQPTSGSTNDVWVSRWTGSAWSTPVTVDNQTASAGKTSIAIDGSGNITVLIQQGSTSNIYANRWNSSTGTWAGASAIDSQAAAVTDPLIGFDANGNGLALWHESANLWARPYTASTNTWGTAVQVDNLSGAITTPQLAVDASGNAFAVWVQNDGTVNSLYASRFDVGTSTWSTPALVESGSQAVPTTADNVSVSVNGNYAAISWLQPTSGTTNDVWVSTWTGSAWTTPVTVDNQAASAAETKVAIDNQGNVTVLIQQGSTTDIYANRLNNVSGPPYYTIPVSSTWQTLANTLYGINSSAAGTALQTAMGGGAVPASGTPVSGWPSTLPVLSTVPGYYTVLGTDTWTTLTQTVYGTSDPGAVAALKVALGNPTLTTGLHLTVPTTLTYTPSTTPSIATQTDISSPLGLVTTMTNDAQGRLTSVLSPTVGAARLETRYGYDANGNVTSITEDPTGANRVTTNQYDANGNLTLTRDALGNTVTRTYGGDNRLVTETAYLVPDPDGAGAGQPSTPLTTRYAYDGEDHLRFVISAEGRVTEYRYNANGTRASSISYVGGRYDVSALSPTTTLSESQLTTWVGTQNLLQIERADYAYDFRGQISTITAFAATDGAGNGVATGASVTRFVYDQRGNLLSKIDPRGETTSGDPNDYVTTFTYDGLGRLATSVRWTSAGNVTTLSATYNDGTRTQTTTQPNGLVTTTVSDRVGRVISVSQSGGFGTTTYKYDADGHLRMVTDPLGIKTQYVYDAAGRKIFSVDGNGTLTEFIYDRSSNVVKTVAYAVAANTSLLVDGGGNPLASVDTTALRNSANGQPAQNQIARAVYDAAHRLVYAIDASGAVTKNTYDGASRLVSQLEYATRVSISASVDELTLAADGSITGVTLTPSATDDRLARSFYDNDGRLTGTLDGAGYLTKYVYDAAGQRTQTIGYYNATQSSLRATGTLSALEGSITADIARDIVTYDFYDGQGRRIGHLDGEKYLTQWVYDVAGNVSQEIRFPNACSFTGTPTFSGILPGTTTGAHITSYQYNELNRVTLKTNYENVQTQYQYDNVGNLIQATTALGTSVARTTQSRYDALGRVTAELTAEGSTQIAALGANPTQPQIDNVWSQYSVKYAYDNDNRIISTTDQYGNVTLFFYDADGRQRFSVVCVTGSQGEVTEQRYNALGQVTDRIQYVNRVSTSGFASGDPNGTLTATVAAAVAGVADSTKDLHTTYTYTLSGQVWTQTTGEGGSVTNTYNAFGELATSSQVIDTSPTTTTLDHSYTYDQRGLQLIARWDPTGLNTSEVRTYDAFGRLKTLTDANGNVTQYAYDRMGRTITVTDPFSKTDLTTYDAFSRVLTTTDRLNKVTQYAYNDTTRSVVVTTPEGVQVTTVHNEQGQTATITDGNGNVTNYVYDANGKLTRVYDTKGDLSRQTYDRAGRGVDSIDANGVITRVSYDAASRVYTRTVDPGGLNLTTTYNTYDGAGHALSVTDERGVVTQTTFDRDGNVTSVTVDPAGLNLKTTYTYDKRDSVKVVTEGVGSSNPRTVTYAYDKLGRRTSDTVVLGAGQPNAVTQYKYDANGNVTRKIDAKNNSTWYVYDANDQLRYTIDALGGVTQTTYDDDGRAISSRRHATAVAYTGSLGDIVTLANLSSLGTPATSTADRLEETVYNRDGRAIYTINTLDSSGNGVVTQSDYDNNGNVVHQRVYLNTIGSGVARTTTAIATALSPTTSDRESFTAYDTRGRATFQVDAAGNVTRNEYDGAGNVIAATQYANTRATSSTPSESTMTSWAGSNASAADRVTRYWYDANGRKLFTLDAEGYLSETRYTDSTRIEETFQYVAKPSTALTTSSTLAQVRAAIVTNANDRYSKTEYDTGGRVSKVTDAYGNYEQYTYDAVGNRLTYRNQKGSVWDYYYDANHRMTDEVGPAVDIWATNTAISTGPTNARITTHMTYDALGNVLTRTEAYGRSEARTTTYEYDALGRQTRTIFPPINVYNATPVSDASVAGTGVVRVETTVSAPDTVVTYNALGDAVLSRDVAGNYTHKVYDTLGRIKYDVDALQYVTEHVYDSFGNETSTTRYAAPLSAGLAASAVWNLSDVQSHLAAQSSVDRTLVKTYDRVNRLIQVTQPAVFNFLPNPGSAPGGVSYPGVGATTVYDYDAFGEVTRQRQLVSTGTYADTYFYFDRRGLQIAQVDARGYLSIAEYDAIGNKTRTVEYAKALGTRPTTPGGSYSGLVTTTPASNPGDAAGYDRETLLTYDRLNRLKTSSLINVEYTTISGDVTTTVTNGTQTTTYDYDAVGNRTVMTDASNAVTYTYYDALGRVVGIAEPARDVDGTNTTTVSIGWQSMGEETFRYRLQGSSTWTTLTAYGGVTLGALANGTYEWTYSYSVVDPMYGQVLGSGNAAGTFVVNGASSTFSQTVNNSAPTFTFTASPPPADSSTTRTPYTELLRDAYGNLVIQAQWAGGATGVTAAGATRVSIAGKDRITRNQFDSYGHVISTTDPEGGVAQKSYDVRGNLVKEWQLVTNNDGGTDALVTIYVFDSLGRQTWTIEPGRLDAIQQVIRTEAVYNSFGEITAKKVNDSQTEYYDYDQAGRVWRTNSGDGVDKIYLYDLQGNNTAEIRSQTTNLKASISSAQQALGLSGPDQMRIETRYDLMGHALEQRNVTFASPAAQESIGATILFGMLTMPNPPNAVYQQVTYQDMYNYYQYFVVNPTSYANGGGWYQVSAPTSANPQGTYARVAESSYSISQRGFLYWDGPTQGVSKTFQYRAVGSQTWQSLVVTQVNSTQFGVDVSGLGNASYEFQIGYTRAGNSTAYAIETGTFSVTNAAVTTLSTSTSAAVGSINITSSYLSGTSLTVTWDPTYGSTATLEVRPTGGSTWQSVNATYYPGDAYTPGSMSATATGLTPGSYDYRITFTSNGTILAVGTGSISVSPSTSTTTGTVTPAGNWGNAIGALTPGRNISVTPGAAVGAVTLLGESLSGSSLTVTWDAAASGSSVLQVRVAGSPTWQTVAGTYVAPSMYNSQYTYATASGIGPGNYEYQIVYTNSGATTALGGGTFSVSSPTSSTSGSNSPSLSWGNAIGTVGATTSTSSASNATVSFSWGYTGYTEYFYWKPSGSSSWSSAGVAGSVNLGSLGAGTYDWMLSYGSYDSYGAFYAAGSAAGQFVVNGASSYSAQSSGYPAVSMSFSAPPPVVTTYLYWPIDSSIAGTPYVYYKPSGTSSWIGLSVFTSGGYYEIATNNLSGSYDWLIQYWNSDGYSSWVTASAQGTFQVSGSSAWITSQTGTASYLSGVTASGPYLYWSRALQSGESLTVTLNGSIGLTPQTSNGTNYYASFNGLGSGTYSYEIAYWYAGSKRVVGSGTLYITTSSTPSQITSFSTPTNEGTVTGFQAISSTAMGWTTAAVGGDTVTFRYRPTGAGSWTGSLTPFAWSTGYGVDFGTGIAGSIDYEVAYYHAGQAQPYRLAYGTTVITPALSWPIDSSITGTPYFYYKPAGSGSWIPLSLTGVGGSYQVPVSGLSGNYDWLIQYWTGDSYSSWVTASAQGTFSVSGSTATVTSQTGTASYLSGVTASGSSLYWSRALQAGESLTVSVNGTALTPQTSNGTNYSASFNGFASGTYAYEIAYWKNGSKVVVGSGSVTITTTVTPSQASMSGPTSVGQISGFYDAGGGLLAWTTPSSGGTVQFRYRAAGASTWAGTLTASAYGGGYAVNLDSPTQISGSIEYEVQYIGSNGLPYKIGYGTTTITRGIQTNAAITDTTSTTLAPINVTPRVQQTFDRWGNVLTSISAALAQTDYRYNQFGAVAQVTLPTQDIVSTINAGVAQYFATRPIQRNYFDILGRVIATRDGDANRVSNGKMNQVQYNAAGQVLLETHADGSTKSYVYGMFGEKLQVADELGFRTRMAYDRNGNLTAQAHELSASGFNNADASDMSGNSLGIVRNDYTYDAAGRRLSETTGEVLNGTSNAETVRYWYDLRGDVIKTTTPRGRATTYEYDIYGNKTLERNANNDTQQWAYDAYGHVLSSTDLGGAVTTYNYNAITKYLTSQTSTLGQNISYAYDAAGHLTSIIDRGNGSASGLQSVVRDTTFSYDSAGRRSRERVVVDGLVQEDTHIIYDAQDRISQLSDLRYSLTYTYDDSGNRTRIRATYYDHGGVANIQDLWYTYDAMNRVLVSQGINTAGDTQTSGSVDISAAQGVRLTYDAKGQRSSATQWGQTLNVVNGAYSFTSDYNTQSYGYDGAGHLMSVDRLLKQNYSGVLSTSTMREDTFGYDKAGRELFNLSQEYTIGSGSALTTHSHSSNSTYDDDGHLMSQTTALDGWKESYVVYGDSTYEPPGSYDYYDPWTGELVSYTWGGNYTPGYDAAGVLRGYIVQVYNTGTTNNSEDIAYTTTYSINYRNGSSYQEVGQTASSVAGAGYPQTAVPQSGYTTRTYNVDGELVSTADSRDASKNRYFANDASGNAITVVQGQYDGVSGRWNATQAFQYALANTGSYNTTHSQHFFFANGQQVGSYGQLADSSGTFKANFDVNYTPVSSSYPDSAPSEVVAQKGDTLRTLAARVFGDQNLWYLIAQENGLTNPDAELDPGTVLRIPNQVVSLSNTANSFKPFDTQAAIGDTTPTQPVPPQPAPKKAKKGCGVLGMILVIVVVIVVTYLSWGSGTGWAASLGSSVAGGGTAGTVAGAAIAAAAGSIAGQAVGLATGVQDKFNWTAVAASALTAGILQGAGVATLASNATSSEFVNAALQGGVNSVVNQGVNIALGLQKSFSWKELAISAVSSGVANTVNDAVGSKFDTKFGQAGHLNNVASTFFSSAASSVASASVRMALGGRLDSTSVLADTFGNAIGNSIVGAMRNSIPAELAGRPQNEIDAYKAAIAAGYSPRDALRGITAPSMRSMFASSATMSEFLKGKGVTSVDELSAADQADLADALDRSYKRGIVTIEFPEGTPPVANEEEQPSVATRVGRGLSRAVVYGTEALEDAVQTLGPKKVEVAMFFASMALGGIPKTIVNYTVGAKVQQYTDELLAPLKEGVSGYIGKYGFDARGEEELTQVKPASDVVAGLTVGFAASLAFGRGFGGLIAGIRRFGETRERAIDAKMALRLREQELRAGLDSEAGTQFKSALGTNFRDFSLRGVKPDRVLEGTNGKVAVIGRSMAGDANSPGVRKYAAALRNEGYEVSAFDGPNISSAATAEWDRVTAGGTRRLTNQELLGTKMYAENKAWAQRLKAEGYTIVDLGSSPKSGFSPFYTMEKSILFGGR